MQIPTKRQYKKEQHIELSAVQCIVFPRKPFYLSLKKHIIIYNYIYAFTNNHKQRVQNLYNAYCVWREVSNCYKDFNQVDWHNMIFETFYNLFGISTIIKKY